VPANNRIQVELALINADDALAKLGRLSGAGADIATNFDLLRVAIDQAHERLDRLSRVSVTPINIQLKVTQDTVRGIGPEADRAAVGFDRMTASAKAATVQVEQLAVATKQVRGTTFIAGASGPAATLAETRFMRATSSVTASADISSAYGADALRVRTSSAGLLGKFNQSARGAGDLANISTELGSAGKVVEDVAKGLRGIEGASAGGARGLAAIRTALLRMADIPQARALSAILQMSGGGVFALGAAGIIGITTLSIMKFNEMRAAAEASLKAVEDAANKGLGPAGRKETASNVTTLDEIAQTRKEAEASYPGPKSAIDAKIKEILTKAGYITPTEFKSDTLIPDKGADFLNQMALQLATFGAGNIAQGAGFDLRNTGIGKRLLGPDQAGATRIGNVMDRILHPFGVPYGQTVEVGAVEDLPGLLVQQKQKQLKDSLLARKNFNINPDTGLTYAAEEGAPEAAIRAKISKRSGEYSAGTFDIQQKGLLDQAEKGQISLVRYNNELKNLEKQYEDTAEASKKFDEAQKKEAENRKARSEYVRRTTRTADEYFKSVDTEVRGENPYIAIYDKAEARMREFASFSQGFTSQQKAQFAELSANATAVDLFKAQLQTAFTVNDLKARANDLLNNPATREAYANAQSQRRLTGLENINKLQDQLQILTGNQEAPEDALRRRLQEIYMARGLTPAGRNAAIIEASRGVSADVIEASGQSGLVREALQNSIDKQRYDMGRTVEPIGVQTARADLESMDTQIKALRTGSTTVRQADIDTAGKMALAQLEKISPDQLPPDLLNREVELINQQVSATERQAGEAAARDAVKIGLLAQIAEGLNKNLAGKSKEDLDRLIQAGVAAQASISVKIDNNAPNADVAVSGDGTPSSSTGSTENSPGVTNPGYASPQPLDYGSYGQGSSLSNQY
jgi:hypothetical protein